MRLYEHQVGRYRLRCQYEDKETAEMLVRKFIPEVLLHVVKLKSFDPELDELPEMNGVGYKFNDELLTIFAQGTDVLVLDQKGVRVMAKALEGKEEVN